MVVYKLKNGLRSESEQKVTNQNVLPEGNALFRGGKFFVRVWGNKFARGGKFPAPKRDFQI